MKRVGFTLIELMLVIAIITVIAAIAIPNMFRAKMSANEANAIGSLRTIYAAEMQYQNASIDTTNGINQFGALDELSAATPPFLDAVLGTEGAIKAGYSFTTTVVPGDASSAATFSVTAIAQSPNLGSRNFYIDIDGAIFWVPQADGAPNSTNNPL